MKIRVHAVVLASGLSRRFACYDKLFLPCPDGKKLAEQGMNAASSTKGIDSRLFIYSNKNLAPLSEPYGFTAVLNADFTEGKAAAVRLAAKTAGEGGLLFIAADQPEISTALLEQIIAAAKDGADAVFTEREGNATLPAYFSEKLRPFLEQITGEQGGKDALRIFEQNYGKAKTVLVTSDSDAAADIDTWSNYLTFLLKKGKKHVLITGGRGEGKSTLVRAIEAETDFFDGIRTFLDRNQNGEENFLFIERLATSEKRLAAKLAKKNKKLLEFYPEVFNEFASESFSAARGMQGKSECFFCIDELGRIEASCLRFHNSLRRMLDSSSGIRLIAALQDGDIAFNTELARRQDCIVLRAAP